MVRITCLLCLLVFAESKRENSASDIVLVSGPSVKFSNGKAKNTLTTWAKELNKNSGSVTHYQAVNREREVVENINSGLWDVSVYHEYQRMSSVTGNVDSANLLLSYGIKQTIDETIQTNKGLLGKLFNAISNCDLKTYNKLITSNSDLNLNMAADDGTNLLMVAAFYNCIDITQSLLLALHEDDVDTVGIHGMNAFLIAAASGHSDILTLLLSSNKVDTPDAVDINIKHKFNGNNALHMAAELDRSAAIQTLCEHQPHAGSSIINTTATTNSGSTALHIAASSNASYDTVHNLIYYCHIPVNTLLNGDTTALYLASQYGYVQTVTALLQHPDIDVSYSMPLAQYQGEKHISVPGSTADSGYSGSVINTEPGNGAEAIHVAAENGHAEVVRVLVTLGHADINTLSIGVTPLHLAAQYNRLEVAKVLLELGANINSLSYVDRATPLYHAVGHGYLAFVEYLLQQGAGIHWSQRSGAFPLLYAAIRDTSSDGDMVQLLLRYGAHINDFTTDSHLSPLLAAIQYNNTAAVRVLLRHGTDVSTKQTKGVPAGWVVNMYNMDKDHSTILHYAVLSNNIDIMRLINASLFGMPLNSENSKLIQLVNTHTLSDGATALHYAAARGYTDMVHHLLILGADIHSKMVDPPGAGSRSSSHGATAMYLAVNGHHIDTAYLLLHCGANTDTKLNSPSHITPLLLAIDKNMPDMVSLLLTGKHPSSSGSGNGEEAKLVVASLDRQVQHVTSVHKSTKPAAMNENKKTTKKSASSTLVHLADPNIGIPSGKMQSPLLFAVSKGYFIIIKMLLDSGAYCNVLVATSKESIHNTALQDTLVDIARKRRDYDSLQVLMSFTQCDPSVIKQDL